MNPAERANEPTLLMPNNTDSQNVPTLSVLNRIIHSNDGQNRAQGNNYAANKVRMGVAVAKIVVSSFVLIFTETKCEQPLRRWLIMMIIYDILILFAQYLIKIAPQNNNEGGPQQGYFLGSTNQRSSEENNGFDSRIDEESGVRLPRNPQTRIREYFDETCRVVLLARIQSFTTMFYIMLWVYGQMLFLKENSDCYIQAPVLTRVVYTYLIFQYITFVIPFFFICFCVVFILIIARRFPRLLPTNQVPATENIINNLPTKKFPTEFPGDPECRICMCEYAEGEDIIQLQCSNLHHFHADCIKKWLKVNGICPICRKKLEEITP